jgi:5-methyltetrahydrofolate--homocysteine methyltransferase
MRDQFIHAVAEMEEDEALRLVGAMLDAGTEPQLILDACKDAMALVGERYDAREYFLPELIIAGELMKAVADLVKPRMAEAAAGPRRGRVVIGTVAGDIHDIGKDVVIFMLDVNGFEVVDLGVDVPAEVFVERVREARPQVVAMSGFLTLAFDQMRVTVQALADAGLRDGVRVMIGGAIMDDEVAAYVGADAYGRDAQAAVRLAGGWIDGADEGAAA